MLKKNTLVLLSCLLLGLFAPSSVQADEAEHEMGHGELAGEKEHSPHKQGTTHKEVGHHGRSQGFKIMGVSFGVISGILTIISLLTTFTIGMLRRFGKRKLNMNLHHYAAYTTVTLACIHAIYNLVTHL